MTEKRFSDQRDGVVTTGRSIEQESFEIIDRETGDHPFPPEQWEIVRRVIHTTGDFEFTRIIRIHQDAVNSGVAALREGATLFTDTRMIKTGLSPWRLDWYGNPVEVPATDPQTHELAEQNATTRSAAAFRLIGKRLNGQIAVVGNAPTALLEILRLIRDDQVRPALVIGVPVGFVRAAESKDLLWQLEEQPSITVLGPKGGSTIAVAVIHALLELAGPPDAGIAGIP